MDINWKQIKILELCSKNKNIFHISQEINLAYKNTLDRLKKYEKEGLLKKNKVKNVRGLQTLYELTPKGKKILKESKDMYEQIDKIIKKKQVSLMGITGGEINIEKPVLAIGLEKKEKKIKN